MNVCRRIFFLYNKPRKVLMCYDYGRRWIRAQLDWKLYFVSFKMTHEFRIFHQYFWNSVNTHSWLTQPLVLNPFLSLLWTCCFELSPWLRPSPQFLHMLQTLVHSLLSLAFFYLCSRDPSHRSGCPFLCFKFCCCILTSTLHISRSLHLCHLL